MQHKTWRCHHLSLTSDLNHLHLVAYRSVTWMQDNILSVFFAGSLFLLFPFCNHNCCNSPWGHKYILIISKTAKNYVHWKWKVSTHSAYLDSTHIVGAPIARNSQALHLTFGINISMYITCRGAQGTWICMLAEGERQRVTITHNRITCDVRRL